MRLVEFCILSFSKLVVLGNVILNLEFPRPKYGMEMYLTHLVLLDERFELFAETDRS